MKNSRIGTTPATPVGIKRGEALWIAFGLVLFALLTMEAGVFFVQVCVRDEGAATRKELGRQRLKESHPPSAPPRPEDTAVFHWDQCLQKMEQGLEDLGMTHRQIQVSRGILCQETYRQIAKRLRVDERTIRDHASYAFRKVGCTRKTDFFLCALAAIQTADEGKTERLEL